MHTNNICHFILHKEDSLAVHTVHFVLETKLQKNKPMRTESLHKMYYVVSGRGRFRCAAREDTEVAAGDIFFSFQGMPYLLEPIEDFRYMYVSFIGTRANLIMDRMGILQKYPVFHHCEELGQFWEQAIRMHSEMNDVLSESVLLYSFAALNERYRLWLNTENAAGALCGQVELYIDQNLNDPELSLEKISGALSYSPKYLSAQFKKFMGIGIVDYIRTVRIQNACAMMKNGFTSVNNISVCCGYTDPQYFSRIFREKNGVSPREFIRLLREEGKLQMQDADP